MSDARVENVYADQVEAREFLDQAEIFMSDARTDVLNAISHAVLLHNATAVGLRVTAGDRSHALRLEAALDQLDADTEELLERLDASRERRNEVRRMRPDSCRRPAFPTRATLRRSSLRWHACSSKPDLSAPASRSIASATYSPAMTPARSRAERNRRARNVRRLTAEVREESHERAEVLRRNIRIRRHRRGGVA
jgi:hypothetical protein